MSCWKSWFKQDADLGDLAPEELRSMPAVMGRVAAVRKYRLTSKRRLTLKLADRPTQFSATVIPERPFVVVPEVSSEKREYVLSVGWSRLQSPAISCAFCWTPISGTLPS